MQVQAYLYFNGDCLEAFETYAKICGGSIQMMLDNENAPADAWFAPETRKRVFHASIKLGDTIVFGSDAMPGQYQAPAGFAASLAVGSVSEAERIFDALSDRGMVRMPMAPTFFAERFGMVVDRFGTPWMVIYEGKGR